MKVDMHQRAGHSGVNLPERELPDRRVARAAEKTEDERGEGREREDRWRNTYAEVNALRELREKSDQDEKSDANKNYARWGKETRQYRVKRERGKRGE